MKFTLKPLVISSVALCATAAFAANQAKVDVPFGFTAQGQSYPAGLYEVTSDMNQHYVTLASKADTSKHITWLVGPADAAKAPTVVTFDQAGNGYVLKTVQLGDRITPRLDTGSKGGVSATTSIGGQ